MGLGSKQKRICFTQGPRELPVELGDELQKKTELLHFGAKIGATKLKVSKTDLGKNKYFKPVSS